ncbi:MAG: WD40/YVTN/BNR-like repeat-containing protein [bacterium]
MNKLSSLALFPLILLVTFSAQIQAAEIEYAETMPKATESLLLGATTSNNRAIVVGERGHILLSEDRKTWRQPGGKGVPTRSTLTDVTSIGNKVWAVGHDAIILHSEDGGESWDIQNENRELQQPLLTVLFTDEKHGYAGGAYGFFLITSDGGKNWKKMVINDELDFHINDIVKLKDGSIFLVAEAGNAFLRKMGSMEWVHLELPYAGSMFGGLLTAEGNILVYGLRGHAMESPDLGQSWYPIKTGTLSSLFGGIVRKDGVVVLVGAKGAILTRKAGASDFQLEQDKMGKDLSSLLILSPKTYLTVGEGGLGRFTSRY